MDKRLNIGLMISHLEDDFSSSVCRGAVIGAKEVDANLIVFPGRYIEGVYADTKRTEYEYQYNTLFSYAHKESIDILLVLIGTIGNSLSPERKKKFLTQYDGIPIITLACEVEGYPYVCFDNTSGLRDCIEHVLKSHDKKKIGFVSGPKTNEDAIARLNAYKSVLEENGIEYDENRVVYGRFSPYSRAVVEDLLDRNPDLEGIIFANDAMALGAYDVFEERGIKVGSEFSVTGFDDTPASSIAIPPLTTVRADAAEIGYAAVLECLQYAETGEIESHYIPSEMITRISCGCAADRKNYDTVDMFNNVLCENDTMVVVTGCEYLFGTYKTGDEVSAVRNEFGKLIKRMFKEISGDECYVVTEKTMNDFIERLELFLNLDNMKYINYDRLQDFIEFLKMRIASKLSADINVSIVYEMFGKVYKIISKAIINFNNNTVSEMEFLRWQSNSIAKDMLMFDSYDDSSYGTVTDKLVRLHMNSSYLYLFENTINNYKDDIWKHPEKILLKSYHNMDTVEVLPAEEQELSVKCVFNNRYMPDDRRYTMVVTPIFINSSHYGLFICELEYEYFYYINSLVAQLCAAMKIIRLIQDKEGIRVKLEESLLEIQEKNLQLDAMAKVDELTNVYNRRGFFVQASNMIYSPVFEGKKAIVVFADINSLKIINDDFSHEDGDFAIKNAAAILSESFRSTDVIGRIGGDEFAVFALVDGSDEVKKTIKERISIATNNFNDTHNKPYLVHMSVGIFEFECSTEIDLHDILSKADTLLYEEKLKKPSLFR